MADKSKRIDWHRITFWGSIGVAAIFIFFASFDKDRRITTVFESKGRYELARYLRYNHPETADWLGLNDAPKINAPVTSSR